MADGAGIRCVMVGIAGEKTVLAEHVVGKASQAQREIECMRELGSSKKVSRLNSKDTVLVRDLQEVKFNYKTSGNGIVFVVVTPKGDIRLALDFLDAIQQEFHRLYGEQTPPSAGSCQRFADYLKNEAATFNDPHRTRDKITQINHTNAKARDVLQSNIALVLERGEKLGDLQDGAEKLKGESVVFKKTSRTLKNKMCWQHYKYCLIATCLFLAIAAFAFFAISGFNLHHKPAAWIFGNGDDSVPTPSPTPPRVPIVIPITVEGGSH